MLTAAAALVVAAAAILVAGAVLDATALVLTSIVACLLAAVSLGLGVARNRPLRQRDRARPLGWSRSADSDAGSAGAE